MYIMQVKYYANEGPWDEYKTATFHGKELRVLIDSLKTVEKNGTIGSARITKGSETVYDINFNK